MAAGEHVVPELEALLEYIKQARGFDFTGYKRQSLKRRIDKRIQDVGVNGYAEYADYLAADADEWVRLFDTALINVTGFFRDDAPWEFLAAEVVPRIIDEKGPVDPIRVWSAGAATGEEAYSLAILFAEALGIDGFRDRVKVYATDVDDGALVVARAALFDGKAVEGVPPPLLEKYFERADGRYAFRKDMRRCVIFGRNDLIQDAPISRIDLLACRNTLMYFDAATQAKVIGRFHFALNEGGFLFLGRAETLLSHSTLFAPFDHKRRIFRKVPNLRARPVLVAPTPPDESRRSVYHGGLRDAAIDASPLAQIVVDRRNTLVLANERARALFGLATADVGRPLQDLELSYRPLDLRSAIDRVVAERRPTSVAGVEWQAPDGGGRWLDVEFTPLVAGAGQLAGVSIAFSDVTTAHELQTRLGEAQLHLQTAFEERQSADEELETMNEELQSTVEELETTNEELQSTNEELETMNEELQSTNSELNAINDELRRQSDELNHVNAFLEAILRSLQRAVVVVDRQLRVLVWSEQAEDLWGVRPDEAVGASFLGLDIGLPVEQLKRPIRVCLAGEGEPAPLTVRAVNRRGKPIDCVVECTPLLGSEKGEIAGVLMLMDEQPAQGA